MPILTYDGVDYPLPDDDFTSTKVPSYNETIQKILARLFGPVSAGGFGGAWAAWIPTWTNLTVGNGTVVAKYQQIGKLVICRLSVVLGSTSSISGDVIFSLPVTRAAYGGTAGVCPLGPARVFDTSSGDSFPAVANNNSTTTSAVKVFDASSGYAKTVSMSSTIPMTWATGDELHAEVLYEAA